MKKFNAPEGTTHYEEYEPNNFDFYKLEDGFWYWYNWKNKWEEVNEAHGSLVISDITPIPLSREEVVKFPAFWADSNGNEYWVMSLTNLEAPTTVFPTMVIYTEKSNFGKDLGVLTYENKVYSTSIYCWRDNYEKI